jgi:hypothetical protein
MLITNATIEKIVINYKGAFDFLVLKAMSRPIITPGIIQYKDIYMSVFLKMLSPSVGFCKFPAK